MALQAKICRLSGFRLLLLLTSIGAASAASAQTPSTDLDSVLRPGMTVWVTPTGGPEAKARVLSVSGETLTTMTDGEVSELRLADLTRVRARRSDSLLDGALIGAGAAVGSGLFMCTRFEPWDICTANVASILRVGAVGAGIGAGIDALIRGRKTIYEAPRSSTRLHVIPLVQRRGAGAVVTVTF
jgi:hypothetical protein